MQHLPLTARLQDYEDQAAALLRAHAASDPEALHLIHRSHPRFLHPEVPWLPLPLTAGQVRASPFDAADARLALARWYSFRDWAALSDLVNAVHARAPGIREFEFAAEAVITGDEAALADLLREKPDLVSARSSRVTCHEPSVHRATLLHYLAANGVEDYRQKTPANAVAIARLLLEAGADPNALAAMYGGECAPLSLLVSSSPPARAGVQTALAEVLLDHGADPDGRGSGNWVSPVLTALVFGFTGTAQALVRRGARVDRLAAAAGLGRLDTAETLLSAADSLERHRALALAAQLGHTPVVRLLLDAGENPDRYNPQGMHSHSTPLHQAALAGHEAVARLLVERGARLDIPDKFWKATPAAWAEHGGHPALAAFLRPNRRRRRRP